MKAPVVFVHGAGGNAATVGPIAAAWSWAELHVPDLPGRGETPGPPRPDVEALASWLDTRVAALGEAPVVVGHSLGGAVALSLALRSPSRVRGIVMVSSGARLRVGESTLRAVDEACREGAPRFSVRFGFGDPSSAAAEQYDRLSASTPPEATAADWRACDGFDVRERLSGLEVPLLVVWGRDDALTPPRFQRWLVERVAGAEGFELDGAHMLPWEAPEAVAGGVRDWMAR